MKNQKNYIEEEVTYKNKETGLMLAGTLSLPAERQKSPAVVLIAGMGPNDRDYVLGEHKFFKVLADYLTKQGIAVLRFDKRGVGKSEGTFDLTLTSKDLANDVLAGVDYLKTRKEVDHKKIGLIGHSEGGLIAPIVAPQTKGVSFLISMAGVVTTSIKHNVEHVALQLRADGATEKVIVSDSKLRTKLFEIITQEPDKNVAEEELLKITEQYFSELSEGVKSELEKFVFTIDQKNYKEVIVMLNSPWYRFLLSYDPAETLKQVKTPVLAINGDHDFVTSSKISLPTIEDALKRAGNKDYKIIEFPKLNHWFQECETGALVEYGQSEHTIAPVVLQTIVEWVQSVCIKYNLMH